MSEKNMTRGRETTKARDGQKVITDRPIDKSSAGGKTGTGDRGFKGSATDLSHSIKGANAHQGRD
jgi:hypothetical protein